MNQPNASESALRDECPYEFRPLIRVKVGLAVRMQQYWARPDLPSGLPELAPCEDLTRAASRKEQRVKSTFLSDRFQQGSSAV